MDRVGFLQFTIYQKATGEIKTKNKNNYIRSTKIVFFFFFLDDLKPKDK